MYSEIVMDRVSRVQSKIEIQVERDNPEHEEMEEIKKDIAYIKQSYNVFEIPLGNYIGEQIKIKKIASCYMRSLTENKEILPEELRDSELLKNSNHRFVNIPHLEEVFNRINGESCSQTFFTYYINGNNYRSLIKPRVSVICEDNIFSADIKNYNFISDDNIEVELCDACLMSPRKEKIFDSIGVYYDNRHFPKLMKISELLNNL